MKPDLEKYLERLVGGTDQLETILSKAEEEGHGDLGQCSEMQAFAELIRTICSVLREMREAQMWQYRTDIFGRKNPRPLSPHDKPTDGPPEPICELCGLPRTGFNHEDSCPGRVHQ